MPGTWEFTFVKEGSTATFRQSGQTPCAAKDKAYIDLETLLKQQPEAERQGWRLISITPVFDNPQS